MLTRTESNLRVIWLLIVRLAMIVAAGYFLYRVRSILITVALAIILAYVALPVVNFICRSRLCRLGRAYVRLIATTIVFVALIALMVFAVRMFVSPFGVELAKLADNLDDYAKEIKSLAGRAAEWYQALPPDAKDFIRRQNYGRITSGLTEFARRIVTGTFEWVTHVIDIILIPVLAFYFVLDNRSLRRDFLAIVPRRRLREALLITRNTGAILQSYVIGQLILCLIAGLLTAVVLSWLRMDYVLVLSSFAGITRAIPIIGPIFSGIPIVLLGIATRSVDTGLLLLIFVVTMHFAESKFIMPKLIGDRMRLHPAVVIIVLLIGAEFFGLLGMFLAAPVAAVIRELIRFYIVKPSNHRLREDQPSFSEAGIGSGEL